MAKNLTPGLRSLQARAAQHARWKKTPDRTAATAPGRAAFNRRFEREVDPDNQLTPEIRAMLAESARKEYFAKLAARSVEARAARKAKAGDTPEAA